MHRGANRESSTLPAERMARAVPTPIPTRVGKKPLKSEYDGHLEATESVSRVENVDDIACAPTRLVPWQLGACGHA